jgi:hypothetical protein
MAKHSVACKEGLLELCEVISSIIFLLLATRSLGSACELRVAMGWLGVYVEATSRSLVRLGAL